MKFFNRLNEQVFPILDYSTNEPTPVLVESPPLAPDYKGTTRVFVSDVCLNHSNRQPIPFNHSTIHFSIMTATFNWLKEL